MGTKFSSEDPPFRGVAHYSSDAAGIHSWVATPWGWVIILEDTPGSARIFQVKEVSSPQESDCQLLGFAYRTDNNYTWLTYTSEGEYISNGDAAESSSIAAYWLMQTAHKSAEKEGRQ